MVSSVRCPRDRRESGTLTGDVGVAGDDVQLGPAAEAAVDRRLVQPHHRQLLRPLRQGVVQAVRRQGELSFVLSLSSLVGRCGGGTVGTRLLFPRSSGGSRWTSRRCSPSDIRRTVSWRRRRTRRVWANTT